jgi:hypothetical protein
LRFHLCFCFRPSIYTQKQMNFVTNVTIG